MITVVGLTVVSVLGYWWIIWYWANGQIHYSTYCVLSILSVLPLPTVQETGSSSAFPAMHALRTPTLPPPLYPLPCRTVASALMNQTMSCQRTSQLPALSHVTSGTLLCLEKLRQSPRLLWNSLPPLSSPPSSLPSPTLALHGPADSVQHTHALGCSAGSLLLQDDWIVTDTPKLTRTAEWTRITLCTFTANCNFHVPVRGLTVPYCIHCAS